MWAEFLNPKPSGAYSFKWLFSKKTAGKTVMWEIQNI